MIADLINMPNDDGFSAPPVVTTTLYKEACKQCHGTGRYYAPSQHGSNCFKCDGKGYHEFKTSPQYRLHQGLKKIAVAAAKAEKIAANAKAWRLAHVPQAAWIDAHVLLDNFAFSLATSLSKYGNLTQPQVDAIDRQLVSEAGKAAAAAKRLANAPVIEVQRIEEAFSKALASGLQKPRLRLGAFKFKPAKDTGKNPGAIYVTTADAEASYLGKVMGGKFLKVRNCTDEQEAEVISCASNPGEAAKAYGQLTGRCAICSLPLTDPESVQRGIGPICADKYGF